MSNRWTSITLYLQLIKIRQTLGKKNYFKHQQAPQENSYFKTFKNLNASFQTKSGFRPTLDVLTHALWQFYTPANYTFKHYRRNESRRESKGICWRCWLSFVIQHYGGFDGFGNSRVGQTNVNIRFTLNTVKNQFSVTVNKLRSSSLDCGSHSASHHQSRPWNEMQITQLDKRTQ